MGAQASVDRWPRRASCESASNLDPTPIEHQIVEAEAELFISDVFDRRPTGTPSFFLENRLTATR
jgi:hypothetical protein